MQEVHVKRELPHGTLVFVGQTCACWYDGAIYRVVVRASGQVVGRLEPVPRRPTWCFVPEPGTRWSSATLSELGVWLRGLTRAARG